MWVVLQTHHIPVLALSPKPAACLQLPIYRVLMMPALISFMMF